MADTDTRRRTARGDLPDRIIGWLEQNPGQHRPRDVALGLGVPTDVQAPRWNQKVGNELGRLARRGEIVRKDFRVGTKQHLVGHYAAKEQP